MLCSKCSEKVRPVVAVDIDGTLGNYHTTFTAFASAYLGRPLPEDYDGSMPFFEWLGLGKDLYRQIKLAYRQGGMKRIMEPVQGAAEFMDAIRDAGAEIWITTTRPYLRLDNIDPDTRFWMSRHGFQHDFMLYDERKYEQLLDHVDKDRVVMILEDDPEQIDYAQDIYGVNIVVQACGVHNSHRVARRSPHVATLTQAATWATDRLVEWKETHGNT